MGRIQFQVSDKVLAIMPKKSKGNIWIDMFRAKFWWFWTKERFLSKEEREALIAEGCMRVNFGFCEDEKTGEPIQTVWLTKTGIRESYWQWLEESILRRFLAWLFDTDHGTQLLFIIFLGLTFSTFALVLMARV